MAGERINANGCEDLTEALNQPNSYVLEDEVLPEPGELLLSAERFAKYLTNRYPQVDTHNAMSVSDSQTDKSLSEASSVKPAGLTLNYHLAGSLATMLLARSGEFTDLDEGKIPAVCERERHEIPESAQPLLMSFARFVGDIDCEQTRLYRGRLQVTLDSYGKVTSEEYDRTYAELLWEATMLWFDEIPDDAKACLRQEKGRDNIHVDTVETYGPARLARITVEGRDYFIARPDVIFAYKVLHLLMRHGLKPGKFNADFGKLFSAMAKIYGEQVLLQTTRQVLDEYEVAMERTDRRVQGINHTANSYEPQIPRLTKELFENRDISLEIRDVVEKLQM